MLQHSRSIILIYNPVFEISLNIAVCSSRFKILYGLFISES